MRTKWVLHEWSGDQIENIPEMKDETHHSPEWIIGRVKTLSRSCFLLKGEVKGLKMYFFHWLLLTVFMIMTCLTDCLVWRYKNFSPKSRKCWKLVKKKTASRRQKIEENVHTKNVIFMQKISSYLTMNLKARMNLGFLIRGLWGRWGVHVTDPRISWTWR